MLNYKCNSNNLKLNLFFTYFVLDFEAGGDLHRRLKQTNGIPYGLGRLCLAEILLAIEYLHSQSIIVRDLKSENVLIDKHGHIVLADFGLAKHLKSTGRCYDRCGTMQYMAPGIGEWMNYS